MAVREQDKTEKFEFSWVIWERCSWTGTRKIVYLLEKDPSMSLVVKGFSRNNELYVLLEYSIFLRLTCTY